MKSSVYFVIEFLTGFLPERPGPAEGTIPDWRYRNKMYAIVETGGTQVKVSEGEILRIPKIEKGTDQKISLDRVLLVVDGQEVKIGRPYLEGVSVEAEIVGSGKESKVTVFKFKRRVKYRRKIGHRQPYTEIKVNSIKIK
jgi:large subunit ribosomal protein L21